MLCHNVQVVRDVPRVVVVLSSVALPPDPDLPAQPALLAHFLAMPKESAARARGNGSGGNPLAAAGNKRRKVKRPNKENVAKDGKDAVSRCAIC